MSISTNSKPRATDDEIDLVPLLQALWTSKITIIVTTAVGAAISFSLYAMSPEQWTASTYITKSSLYSLYKEVNEKDTPTSASPLPLEVKLYSSIQNDVFYTAMGVMAAKSISLKEAAPRTGNGESVLYVASSTATTGEQARALLKSALDSANTEALALNLPALNAENNVRAFNTLDEIKVAYSKSANKFALLGGVLGCILGSLFVIGRFLSRQYKQANRG